MDDATRLYLHAYEDGERRAYAECAGHDCHHCKTRLDESIASLIPVQDRNRRIEN